MCQQEGASWLNEIETALCLLGGIFTHAYRTLRPIYDDITWPIYWVKRHLSTMQ